MTIVGCIKEAEVVGGVLTVNNCPEKSVAMICKDSYIESTSGILMAVKDPVALGRGMKSPFPLYIEPSLKYTLSGKKSPSGLNSKSKEFTLTGSFMVVIASESDLYFLKNVSFDKGFATIDFNDMISQKSISPFKTGE